MEYTLSMIRMNYFKMLTIAAITILIVCAGLKI